MIGAHKVLAGLRLPRAAAGHRPLRSRRDNRAIWPSTGNYCRGGVAISRILGCRGVAVLPAGMSRERFDWLAAMGDAIPRDIIRTPGTESNVKEIYDKCAELSRDQQNVILNQFSEFANYLIHYHLHRTRVRPRVRPICEAGAQGLSSRRLRLGDRLGRHHRRRRLSEDSCTARRSSRSRRSNARPCCDNGYGEHNIQGIGDKHIPLIHNVMNTDVVIGGVGSRRATALNLLFTQRGRPRYLRGRAQDSIRRSSQPVRRYRHFRPRQHRRRDQARQAPRLRAARRRS